MAEKGRGNIFKTLKKVLKVLGPGIITGASGDDPSGIATYAQTGAQFGYGQLWSAFYMLPLLIGVQEACARIGAVTGKGIATLVREHFSRPVLYSVVLLIFIANTINIGKAAGFQICCSGSRFSAWALPQLPCWPLLCIHDALARILRVVL